MLTQNVLCVKQRTRSAGLRGSRVLASGAMADVVVCGSMNMDVFAYASRLPRPGETLSDADLEYAAGGKGANQAVAAARLGAATCFVGARGDDGFGVTVLRSLEQAGVDTDAVLIIERQPTGVALILVGGDGENQIVVAPGANRHPSTPPDDLDGRVWVTQAETPVETAEATLRAARRAGGIAVVNPAPAGRLPADLVRQFDVAVVNETELEALGDDRPATVVLTLGSAGARIWPDGPVLPVFPAKAVDTTGAGDALVGGLAAGLADGMQIADALRLGMAAAAVCVERRGCQPAMPTRAEADARLAAGA
jgi:ribokinase